MVNLDVDLGRRETGEDEKSFRVDLITSVNRFLVGLGGGWAETREGVI